MSVARAVVAASCLAVSVVVAACSDTGSSYNPVAPGSFSTGLASTERRVQPIGGGGIVCGDEDDCPLLYGGQVVVEFADGGRIAATYHGAQERVDWRLFGTSGPVGSPITGEGRFAGLTGWLHIGVSPEGGRVLIEFLRDGNSFAANPHPSPAAAPEFTVSEDPSCPSGQFLVTRFRTQLEHFGTAQVTDRHCIPE